MSGLSRGEPASVAPLPLVAQEAEPRTYDVGLALMAVIWGINFSVIKVALEVLPPLAFNALRFPVAALVLTVLLVASGKRVRPARRDIALLIALGLLGNVLYQALFVFSLAQTHAGTASILLATTPVWTASLSIVFGLERFSQNVSLGIVGTLFGICLVVLGAPSNDMSLASHTWTGDLLMVGASVTWAVYTIAGTGLVRRYGSLPVTTWTLWVGTLGVVLVGLPDLLATDLARVSAGGWIGVLYAGGLSIGVAYLIWYRGVERIGGSRTSLYSNAVPVVALLVAWIWLSERPTALQVAGATAILVSLRVARRSRPVLQTEGGGPGNRERGSAVGP